METNFQPVTAAILEELAAIVGQKNLSTLADDRQRYSHDVSNHPPRLSDVVVWPQTAQQTADVLRLAAQRHIPVTPWGAGTSVEGNPIPVFGGILLSTEKMQTIVAVHPHDFQVTVEAGIKYKELGWFLWM
jgi:D-lactate dehydrogenase (cytochrome)